MTSPHRGMKPGAIPRETGDGMSWADHYREMERYAAELEQLLSGTSHRRIRAQDDWRP